MSVYNFVVNLQRKSPQAKKRILALLLFVSFVALVSFWVVMFRYQVSQTNLFSTSPGPVGKAVEIKEKMISPIAALGGGFSGLKDDVAKKFGDIIAKYEPQPSGKVRPVYELPIE